MGKRMNLKLFRVKHGLSQQQMADKIGYVRTSYTSIEAGKRNGRQDFWQSLQDAFNIPEGEMWDLMKIE